MTYEEVMAAARRADAAGEASDARRLLEIAVTLPDRPQQSASQTAPAPQPGGMVEVELFDGTILEFPQGTDSAVIDRAARKETQTRRQPSPGIRVDPSPAMPAQVQAAGPWDKYAQPAPVASGPWEKYGQQGASQAAPSGMNIYEVEVDGKIYDIEAADEATIARAVQDIRAGTAALPASPTPTAPAAPAGLIEVEIPDGRILQFPAGTSQDVMRGAIDKLLAAPAPAPVDTATGRSLPSPITPPAYYDGTVAPGQPQAIGRAGQAALAAPGTGEDDPVDSWLLDVAASGAKGVREGLTAIPDAAVHAVNNAPRLLNLPKMLPGMEDAYPSVGSITDAGAAFDNWIDGDGSFSVPEGVQTAPATLRDATGAFGALDYEPQTGAGRFAERVGSEIGASTLPVAGALRFGERFVSAPGVGSTAHEGIRQMVEPFVRRPGAAVSKEMAGATAAGVGAASANAAHDMTTGGEGGTWWTDLLSGMGGLGVAALGDGLTQSVANIGRHVTNSPKHRDMIAGEAVADRLVDNSTTMQGERFAGRPLDAEVLARRLDRPTQLENLVPEYRAGTADRSGDSGVRSLAYNTEALAPGAANTRRERNMSAVGDYIRDLLPDGNAPAFLETVRDAAGNIIDTARSAAGSARTQFDAAADAARPRMQPIDRGQAIRDDMSSVYEQRRGEYRQAYDDRDAAMAGDRIDARVPYEALQDQAGRMTTYERGAYVPADVMNSARQLAPGEAAPQPTGLVDMFGQPIMRPVSDAPAEIPLTEVLSLRQGLTMKQREALSAGRSPEHRALTQLSGALRQRIDDAMSPETRALDDQARGLRRSVAADFEDGNLPSRILDDTARGRSRMATETIAPRVTAAETPYRDTMRHVGTRDGSRTAVRDQILADAQNAGAMRNQDALNDFLSSRAYQFDDFPEARAALEAAGSSKSQLDRAEAFVMAQEKRYAPGASSPVGRFTRHDDTGVADAMRGLWKSPQPREAVRQVLETAGRTPQNLKNARAAFFEDMARTTTNTAHDAAGNIVWNGRMLDGFLKNPKVGAVMDELWTGNEDHLKNLRQIGEALIDSESSLRARPVASSGTASISLQGKVDPALTATSVSSTMRSVQRGQMSVPIAGVHLLSGWIRGRSTKVHAAAINELMTKAMDDPKLAAELLRKHNPYDAQVMGRSFLRKFGLRVPQLATIVSEELGGYSEQDQGFDEFVGMRD